MKNVKGFSLIELIVGMFISMLVMLTVAGSAKFLDTQKKINIGTNSVLETLAITNRTVSSNIKMAGFGLASCPTTIVNGVTLSRGVTVTAGATDKDSDTLNVFFGDSLTGISKSFLINPMAAGSATFTIGYAGHLRANEFALFSGTSGCSISQVNNAPVDQPDSSYYTVGLKTPVPLNYASNDAVQGLSSVRNLTYTLASGNLTETDSISTTAVVVASNIAFIKYYYGLNDGNFVAANTANNEGTDWSAAGLALSPTNVARIRSIRMLIVVQSPIIQQRNAAGECAATVTAPTAWEGGPALDFTDIPDWQCYKYKVSDTIVPLKNILFSANI